MRLFIWYFGEDKIMGIENLAVVWGCSGGGVGLIVKGFYDVKFGVMEMFGREMWG